MPIVILEGLTGAGKSSTLEALQAALQARGHNHKIIYEEETFGELMDELANGVEDSALCHRLEAVLAGLSQGPELVILERFHPSYFALRPEWELYEAIDQRLDELGAQLVLLTYPPEKVVSRALYRNERESEGWSQGFIDLYGSEAAALSALSSSLRLRTEAVHMSALPLLTIDTSSMDWAGTANAILDWAQSSV